ncbi:MAG: vanadium-dependent haloperoxidase [Chloroflexi bacterium]|nr:vanadium-dependent haloperoxidase [Chloroflexota bacterium]
MLANQSWRATSLALAAALVLAAGGALAVRSTVPSPRCPPIPNHAEWSVARRWDEALLDAIRRALPAPTVHARNLFHTSAAMWDAWAVYEPGAAGYFVTEKQTAQDVPAARNEAMSYAAYRVLSARYINSVGGEQSLSEFDDLMDGLCYPLDVTSVAGNSAAAVGNRIAAVVLAYGLTDGSNQASGYLDSNYSPANPPLVVAQSGTKMTDPNRWQPLQLEHMISQNGIAVVNGLQQFVGPHWGGVKGFALPGGGADRDRLPLDPGPPPRLGDAASDRAFKDEAVEVIRDSSTLDPSPNVTLDMSPGARGNNPLGTNDGAGRPLNPFTAQPYAADVVNQGDFGRALAEFWADGPNSETPPGHWNVIANAVSDQLAPELRIGGQGPLVDRLQWDIKLYFALNGAVHDGAIAAWGAKGHYDSARPISMIRYMGGLGQSTDPALPSYTTAGLPLVAGLVELIRAETTAPGGRHALLAGHEGQMAIRAWAGTPPDPAAQTGGVAWMLAVNWLPYQAPTFVTPSFAGYFSGHSTFSRAAAEVLTGLTGSAYFPGGLSTWIVKAGSLKFEAGPAQDVPLQWATYFDAADQAGLSRVYGGIHISADDLAGRRAGAACGQAAWALAQLYFAGQIGR